MVNITVLSIWSQLASFQFVLAGLSGDLLIIRMCLLTAYCFLALDAALGGPFWGSLIRPGNILLDLLIWSAISIYIHGSSLITLFRDERKVHFKKDEEALWRVFYRTGGLSALLFKTIICPHLEVVEFEKGEKIPTDKYFYILYTGHVKLERFYANGKVQYKRLVRSSEMFDVNHLGLFRKGNNILEGSYIECASLNKTKLYRFATKNMTKITCHPLAKGVWQSLLIHNLSSVVEDFVDHDTMCSRVSTAGDEEVTPAEIFHPLETWEEPKRVVAGSSYALERPLGHLWYYSKMFFSPPMPFGGLPAGIRHTLLGAPRMNRAIAEMEAAMKEPEEADKTTVPHSTEHEEP